MNQWKIQQELSRVFNEVLRRDDAISPETNLRKELCLTRCGATLVAKEIKAVFGVPFTAEEILPRLVLEVDESRWDKLNERIHPDGLTALQNYLPFRNFDDLAQDPVLLKLDLQTTTAMIAKQILAKMDFQLSQ